MELINSLEKAGLTEKQAKVYLACLELGGAKISDIAKKAKIKRTTCYHLVNELLEMGLLSQTKQKKAGFFLTEEPKILEQNAKIKLQTIQEILPQLNAVYNVLPQKPKIRLYEGVEGIKTVWEEILKVAKEGDTILACTGEKPALEYLPKKFLQDYVQRRLAKKVRIRFITPSEHFAKEYQPSSAKELREIKMVSAKGWDFTADMQICNNKITIVSPKENFICLVIDSKEISQMFKMAFELMWKGAGA
ncbi:hypothetical protein KKH24_01450 [Patescibacteria group bacterium]|nr:hypothetical protein [Patescibacteria group bacterium]